MLGPQLAWDDTVLPFQLDRSDIRGRVARLDGVLDRVLSQHAYPPQIEALVAEAALLTALIGQTIKLRWRLSIQVRGTGPVKMIATDYYGPTEDGQAARIRAYAGFDRDGIETGDPFSLIGEGYFVILIDQGEGMVPYQGITPLVGGSLSACAETYFAQSEQLPTRFAITCGRSQTPGTRPHWRAGGVINWTRANLLLDTVEDLELIGPSVQPTDLLVRLFHEEGPRVFDAQPVRFGCSCSAEKVRRSLSIYSATDIGQMTTDDGVLTADCQFCGAHYEFDPGTLGRDAQKAAGERD